MMNSQDQLASGFPVALEPGSLPQQGQVAVLEGGREVEDTHREDTAPLVPRPDFDLGCQKQLENNVYLIDGARQGGGLHLSCLSLCGMGNWDGRPSSDCWSERDGCRGGGDGPGGTVFALPAWGPEFDLRLPLPLLKFSMGARDCNPNLVLRRKRWADPWALLARQPWLLDECQASEKPSKKPGWMVPKKLYPR